MSNYSKIYWLTRLDPFHCLLTTMAVLSILLTVVIIVGSFMSRDFDQFHEEDEVSERKATRIKWTGRLKYIVPLIFISFLLKTFVPTKNEVILIMAGGKAMNYIQSDTSLSKVPYQTTSIISEYLDKTLKEMKDKK